MPRTGHDTAGDNNKAHAGGRALRCRIRLADRQLILEIFIVRMPFGTLTCTSSLSFLPMSARPTGDSLLILPSRGSASAGPTIVYSCDLPSLRTFTLLPS